MSDDPQGGVRQEEEDHDLLTYNEAVARLVEEAARLEQEQSRLEARQASGEGGLEAEVVAVRDRSAALRRAAERKLALAELDTQASGFLAYRAPGSG